MYIIPNINSFSSSDFLNPCQNQYTLVLYPSTDKTIKKMADSYTFQDTDMSDYIGGGSGNIAYRAFYSFDISSLPGSVVSAKLKLYQTDEGRGTPYTTLGPLTVDHVTFGTLEANSTDFNNNTLTSNIANTTDSTPNSWKEFNVKNAVEADIAALRTTSQYRIRFDNDTSSPVSDNLIYPINFNDQSTGPQLIIEYTN